MKTTMIVFSQVIYRYTGELTCKPLYPGLYGSRCWPVACWLAAPVPRRRLPLTPICCLSVEPLPGIWTVRRLAMFLPSPRPPYQPSFHPPRQKVPQPSQPNRSSLPLPHQPHAKRSKPGWKPVTPARSSLLPGRSSWSNSSLSGEGPAASWRPSCMGSKQNMKRK